MHGVLRRSVYQKWENLHTNIYKFYYESNAETSKKYPMSVGQQCFRNVELKGGLITHLYFQTIFIFRLTPKPRKNLLVHIKLVTIQDNSYVIFSR